MTGYQEISQAIRDGAAAEEVEAMLMDESSNVTDEQIASLRAELRARETETVTIEG